jgi:hypothetical protein
MADKKLLEQIKQRSRIQQKVVRVPRWDIDVTIRELTFREKREAQDAATHDGKIDPIELGVQFISRGAVDPAFTPDEIREMLGDEYSTHPLDWLGSEIQALSKADAGGLKEAENSFPDKPAGEAN